MTVTAAPDAPAEKVFSAGGASLPGLAPAGAIIAVLFHGERTGAGQAADAPMFETMTPSVVGGHARDQCTRGLSLALPSRRLRTPPERAQPAPQPGEHAADVLREIGYDEVAIAAASAPRAAPMAAGAPQ